MVTNQRQSLGTPTPVWFYLSLTPRTLPDYTNNYGLEQMFYRIQHVGAGHTKIFWNTKQEPKRLLFWPGRKIR